MNKGINPKIIILALGLLVAFVFFVLSLINDPISKIQPRKIESAIGLKIIAFGDSLTAGYGLAPNESYPAQLEVALRNQGLLVTVINSGINGETSGGNLERAASIRKQNPDLVLLGIGGNDALRSLPFEEVKNNIEKTVGILRGEAFPPEVVLLRMQAPLNAGLSYKKDFDGMYEEIGKKYNLVVLPFMTYEIFLDSQYKLSDGIHYNKAGYQKIIELYLLEPLVKIIKKMKG